ncbi:MAG: CsgG/HfaB family protein [Treponema sp.]|nr:CsgG/HfaB family protein [Treponema sp.]
MINRKLPLMVLLLTIGAASLWCQEALTLDRALRRLGDTLADRLTKGSVVAILNVKAPKAELSDYVIDELSSYITNDGRSTVVDRQNIQLLQGELQFHMSGDVSDETAQRIGQMTGAEVIISGSVSQIGSEYRLSIRAIEVETARVSLQPQALTVRLDARLAGLLNIGYDEFTAGRRIGASFLNLAAGLGSYTMGDWVGGLIVTTSMGAAAGLLVWELSLDYGDPLMGIPIAAAFGVGGAGVLFGILRPLFYHKGSSKRVAANTPSWPSVVVVPVANKSAIKSVQVLCTWQF